MRNALSIYKAMTFKAMSLILFLLVPLRGFAGSLDEFTRSIEELNNTYSSTTNGYARQHVLRDLDSLVKSQNGLYMVYKMVSSGKQALAATYNLHFASSEYPALYLREADPDPLVTLLKSSNALVGLTRFALELEETGQMEFVRKVLFGSNASSLFLNSGLKALKDLNIEFGFQTMNPETAATVKLIQQNKKKALELAAKLADDLKDDAFLHAFDLVGESDPLISQTCHKLLSH